MTKLRLICSLLILPLFVQPAHLASAADSFAAATLLSGNNATNTDTNASATTEAGEPTYGINSTAFRSLWWKWTPDANGRAQVDLTGSADSPVVGSTTFGKYLGVYIAKGNSPAVNSLALVHSSGGQTSATPNVTFPAAAGTTYYLHVTSEAPSEYGSIKINASLDTSSDIGGLNVQGQARFANDSFAQRIALTGASVSAIGYNLSATVEPGEPTLGSHTLWWSWTAPSTGRVTVSSAGSDTEFQKTMTVLEGSTLSSLIGIQQYVSNVSSYMPSLTFPVTSGKTYQIALGSTASSDGGSFVLGISLSTNTDINQLNINTEATGMNDLFGNRIRLSGSAVSSIGYGAFGTLEPLEPGATGGGSLWWTYTPTAAGTVSLATAGSNTYYNKYLTVWTGNALSSLSQVARSSNTSLPSVSFAAVAGQTYQISVGASSLSVTPGDVVLSLAGPAGLVATPLSGLTIDNAVRLRWTALLGTTYQIRSSNNLQTWTNVGAPIIGDGGVKEVYQPITDSARFYRVVPQ